MTDVRALRKAIKAKYPSLRFIVKTVDFSDLARAEKVFVESPDWGMAKGNRETFEGVTEIARQYDALVSW